MTTADDVLDSNANVFLRDGPRMSTEYGVCVVGIDKDANMVLLDGLGAMGCGRMWADDNGKYTDYIGYSDAKSMKYVQ
jgi:hypothetical protein